MQKQILKTIVSLLMTICIICSAFSFNASAASSNKITAVTTLKQEKTAVNSNKKTAKAKKKTSFDITEFSFPLEGSSVSVTSTYGWRYISGSTSFHAGVDLDLETGDRVNAFKSGKVYKTTYEAGGWGNYVLIYHGKYKGKKLFTGYAHLNKISVKKGQKVSQGQKIGEGGNTGRSFGSHLHFEVYLGGLSTAKPTSKDSYFEPDRVNPMAYIGLENKEGIQKVTEKSLVETSATTPKIKVEAKSNSQVLVKWAATSSRKSYLQQRVSNSSWKTIKETTAKTTAVSSLKIGKKYSYRVKTFYKDYHTAWSDTVSFTPLEKVDNVKATVTNNKVVTLKWNNVSSAKKYYIYSKIGAKAWKHIAITNKPQFVNKVSENTKIKYRVKAVNGNAKGTASDTVSVSILATPQITEASVKASEATLNFNKISGADGYYIYRKSKQSGKYVKIATVKTNKFVDKDLKSDNAYLYKVSAFNECTESQKSKAYLINTVTI